jgi:GNAT superfamily N-acetyltransferase
MDSLSIRSAIPQDAEALSDLLGQLGYPCDAADIPGRIERMHSRPGTTVLVAEHGRKVVGVATVHLFQALHSAEPTAWLTTVVVEEMERGKGVGAALVQYAEDWARERGALRISLTSALRREAAHEFYKAHDYEHTGVRLTKVFTDSPTDSHRETESTHSTTNRPT